MQAELQRVLELQSAWAPQNTPAMAERGLLVSRDIPTWLNKNARDLADAIGIPLTDFFAVGRDATGNKTRVPFARFGSKSESPNAREGFYVVYLWAFDGSAVYLSLNQGTTRPDTSARRPRRELRDRVHWAREVIEHWSAARDNLVALELMDKGLARGYELGDVASIVYPVDAIPPESQLLEDALSFAAALGQLCRERRRRPMPYEEPEVEALEEAALEAAGKSYPGRGAGFRASKEERDLIENHAVDVATAYYRAEGWSVKTVGKPYDLDLTRDGLRWTVEVKGTTSTGAAVALTDGEVRHHADAYPNNALVVVAAIELDRSTTPPSVGGGVLYERQPWAIEEDALRVVAYRYAVPDDLYTQGQGIAGTDLL